MKVSLKMLNKADYYSLSRRHLFAVLKQSLKMGSQIIILNSGIILKTFAHANLV